MSRLHIPRQTRWALLIAAALLALLALPAGAWFSTSTSLTYTITTGQWDDEADDDEGITDGLDGESQEPTSDGSGTQRDDPDEPDEPDDPPPTSGASQDGSGGPVPPDEPLDSELPESGETQ